MENGWMDNLTLLCMAFKIKKLKNKITDDYTRIFF